MFLFYTREMKVILVCAVFGVVFGNKRVCKTKNGEIIDSRNINKFVGCTKIDGDLKIDNDTFYGNPIFETPGIHPNQLGVLGSIREVTGKVVVNGIHPEFKSLSFLNNLTSINGTVDNVSLFIYLSSLESLDLASLTQINNGDVVIVANKNLCYANSIQFDALLKNSSGQNIVAGNKLEDECQRQGLVCSSECTPKGCWGPGKENCVK